MNTGKFIVIEGLEGAGKTTAKETIVNVLRQHKIDNLIFTREPGGTPLAESLRTLIKDSSENEVITDKAELLMLYAARVQLVENIIKPALATGKWVVGDRHDLSSQAYQGGGRGLDKQLMTTLKATILGTFKPDLTLYLDISPEAGLQRARQRGALDRIEKESFAFFERTRQRYLELAQADDSILIINAEQSLENVTRDIQQALATWLAGQGY